MHAAAKAQAAKQGLGSCADSACGRCLEIRGCVYDTTSCVAAPVVRGVRSGSERCLDCLQPAQRELKRLSQTKAVYGEQVDALSAEVRRVAAV